MKLPAIPPRSEPIAQSDGAFILPWYGWFTKLQLLFNSTIGAGFTGTIVTAKLTDDGTNGSITIVNGAITAQVPAT